MEDQKSRSAFDTRRGRKERDEGWNRLRDAIERHLKANRAAMRAPGTPAELAAAPPLWLPPVTVRNWLMFPKARGNPEMSQLPDIASALASGFPEAERDARAAAIGRDLVEAMGVVPSNEFAAELAIGVHRLRTRLLDMQESMAQIARLAGVPAIAGRAVEKGWAVAIWPAMEGPAEGPVLHVADRIDFKRPGTERADDRAVWRDFGDLLRQVGASPITSEWSSPRWVEFQTDASVAGWAVPRVAAPSPSRVQTAWGARLVAVSIVATTDVGWPNDLASHLGDAIGYGMTSTKDVMLDVYGLLTGDDAFTAMATLQALLVGHIPVKRVWSHLAPDDPLAQFRHSTPPEGLAVFWVHESDEHLDLAAQSMEKLGYAPHADALARLHTARDHGDAVARASEDRGIWRLDLPPTVGRTIAERRTSRWKTVFERTRDAIQILVSDGRLDDRALHKWWDANVSKEHAPERAVKVQQWVARNLENPTPTHRDGEPA